MHPELLFFALRACRGPRPRESWGSEKERHEELLYRALHVRGEEMTDDLNEIREIMEDAPLRIATCVHEAGHVYYARRAGAVDMKYYGPTEYPGRPGEFGSAGVEPVFPGEGTKFPLLDMAKWFAAGGVVMR